MKRLSLYTANHILYYYIFVGSAEKSCDVFTDIIIYINVFQLKHAIRVTGTYMYVH